MTEQSENVGRAETAFLPVNLNVDLTKPSTRHTLALIDAARRPDLERFNWQTTPTGQLFRVYYDDAVRDSLGRRQRIRETLAARVLGFHLYDCRLAHRNGDRLDCRASNLFVCGGRVLPPGVFTHSDEVEFVRPGSSFDSTPEFAEALRARLEPGNARALAARFPGGRRACVLTPEVVRQFLEDVQHDPYCKDRSLRWYATQYFSPEGQVNACVSPTLAGRILRGQERAIPGYDYEPLRRMLDARNSKRQALLNNIRAAQAGPTKN